MTKTVESILPRERYRGRIFMALHGDTAEDRIWAVTVCIDFAAACLALAAADDGEIWVVPPNEGGPLRRYLAGGPPPLTIRMAKSPDNLIARTARLQGISKSLARSVVVDAIEATGGLGSRLYSQEGGGSKLCVLT